MTTDWAGGHVTADVMTWEIMPLLEHRETMLALALREEIEAAEIEIELVHGSWEADRPMAEAWLDSAVDAAQTYERQVVADEIRIAWRLR